MDLLKSKVDKTVKSSMIFPNANWIIAYNTDIFITDVNEIDFLKGYIRKDIKESLNDIKKPLKDINEDIKESLEDIKEPLKDINEDIKESLEDIKEPLKDINEDIKEPLEDIKEPLKDINEDTKEPLEDIKEPLKDTKESLEDINEPSNDIKESFKDIKESLKNIRENIKESTEEIIEINNNITPICFIKQRLQLYEDNEIIKTKLFNFISNQKVINKYTKRGTSLIMDGLSQDKWNVNVCKLYSFLLDVTFRYRKQSIKMI